MDRKNSLCLFINHFLCGHFQSFNSAPYIIVSQSDQHFSCPGCHQQPSVLAAVIAFGMNLAACVAEIFRTGIEGVDKGQTEAGIAMGFTRMPYHSQRRGHFLATHRMIRQCPS